VKKNDVGVGRNRAEDVSKENEQEKEGGVNYGGTSFTMKSPVTSSRTVAMEGTK
jgi:hypothetical protein